MRASQEIVAWLFCLSCLGCSDPVVARVNGAPIRRRAFLAQVTAEAQHHNDTPAPENAERLARLERMVLRRMVEAEKVLQAAERLGVPMDAHTLDAQVALRRERLGGAASYKRWLAATRTTSSEFGLRVKEDYLKEEVVARLMPEVQLRAVDLERFYTHQQEELREHAAERAGDGEDDDDEEDREAQARAASGARAEVLPPSADAARAALTLQARANLRRTTYERLQRSGTVEVYPPYVLP